MKQRKMESTNPLLTSVKIYKYLLKSCLELLSKYPDSARQTIDIHKLTNKLEMEAKANKLHKAGRRTKSNEELTTDGRTSSQQFSTPQHRPSVE